MPNFFVEVGEAMKLFFSKIWEIVWPFIRDFLTDEGQLLLQVAKEAVAKVALDPNYANMTWQEKLTMAVEYIVAEMAARGIAVATTDIIDAVQLVYKSSLPTVVPTDDTVVKTNFVKVIADADPDIPYVIQG